MVIELLPNYSLHKSSDMFAEKYTATFVAKFCRFCSKKFPEVSFSTKPHVIPELFGKNSITSNFECDECNSRFQKHESDTSNMVQHYLGLLNIKTKKGVPVFQSNKKPGERSTFLKRDNNILNLNFHTNANDFEFNTENKILTVNFRTKNFRPFSVFKIFLKMGISLLTDEEMSKNTHYLEFLNSDEPIQNGMQHWTAYRYMLKTKYHPNPKVDLYKAKQTIKGQEVYPEYMILICFANIAFQFFLPISVKNINEYQHGNNLQIELFPAFLLEDIKKLKTVDINQLDLSETEKVSITDKIALHYDSTITNRFSQSRERPN